MNKEERPTMPGIVAVTKYLVDIWRGSKCRIHMNTYLNARSAKLDELAKVVNK